MNKLVLLLMMFSTSSFAYDPIRPNPHITPGTIDPNATIEKICTPGYTDTVRHVTESTKQQVFKNYHIDPTRDRYEVDHLIPLELGGSNDITNLWPESYTTSPLNAYKKDALENKLHKLVCSDKITLQEARFIIINDWVKAYHEYVLQH